MGSRTRTAAGRIPAGTATLGLVRRDGGPFGWDNEFEEHSVEVPAFSMDAYSVTNRDFLRFMREGGYKSAAIFGAKQGWQWITSAEHNASVLLDSRRRILEIPRHVRGNPASDGLAGICQPR